MCLTVKPAPSTTVNTTPSKKKHRNGGRSYYYATWGCPDNDTGKLNKHYNGKLAYASSVELEL